MKKILFRTDGGFYIGMGHIVRCINLALYFKTNNIDSIFFTKSENKFRKFIKDKGFECILINSDKDFFNKINNKSLIINDIKDTSCKYMNELKKRKNFCINFDDLGKGLKLADILIDANRNPKDTLLISEVQKHFFGLKYIVLNHDFSDFNKKEKIINKHIKNILLSFGGTDPYRIKAKVLKFLEKRKNNNIQIICPKNVSNMPELLYHADIAIISGGVTMYETACVGTPAIVISQVEHQLDNIKKFKGLFINCGLGKDLKEENFLKEFDNLISNYELRKMVSKKLKKIIDGKGIERVGEKIISIYY